MYSSFDRAVLTLSDSDSYPVLFVHFVIHLTFTAEAKGWMSVVSCRRLAAVGVHRGVVLGVSGRTGNCSDWGLILVLVLVLVLGSGLDGEL